MKSNPKAPPRPALPIWKPPPPTLTGAIYQDLLQAVVSGAYAPGQVLRQEELATRYSVSRVPIREAMNRLAADGLLILRPRRGYEVISLNPEEIREVFELRMLIEERAGALSASARQPADIEEVDAVLLAMERLGEGESAKRRWFELNREFHARLFATSGRRHLCRIASQLRDTVEPYIRLEVSFTGDFDEAEKDHRKIFEAFRRGDARACAAACRLHCEHTAQRLLSKLGKQSPPRRDKAVTYQGARRWTTDSGGP
ncbi:MAG: GntR family transcriptional regulator [Burkholderiales bacterium]|nr:GntR family transcriptional regulator [Burkholderiales bacterium]